MSSASDQPGHVTQLLERWGGGDRSALDELTPLVLGELRQLAAAYLRRERPGHTLQATALVNEAPGRLAAFDPQQARVVELRFFGGLSIEEAAEELGVGHATVEREWALARAWLRKELR